MVVLDTDHMSLLEWEERPDTQQLRARLSQLAVTDVATTIVSFEEQVRGLMSYLSKATQPSHQIEGYRRLKSQLENYCGVPVLEYDDRAAREFERLRHLRVRIGTMDLKIAAIVVAHGATLLTRNLVDFRKVPGLKVEDWTT
jgi:tRNA(fMet)-specific endonuclease VapC